MYELREMEAESNDPPVYALCEMVSRKMGLSVGCGCGEGPGEDSSSVPTSSAEPPTPSSPARALAAPVNTPVCSPLGFLPAVPDAAPLLALLDTLTLLLRLLSTSCPLPGPFAYALHSSSTSFLVCSCTTAISRALLSMYALTSRSALSCASCRNDTAEAHHSDKSGWDGVNGGGRKKGSTSRGKRGWE